MAQGHGQAGAGVRLIGRGSLGVQAIRRSEESVVHHVRAGLREYREYRQHAVSSEAQSAATKQNVPARMPRRVVTPRIMPPARGVPA